MGPRRFPALPIFGGAGKLFSLAAPSPFFFETEKSIALFTASKKKIFVEKGKASDSESLVFSRTDGFASPVRRASWPFDYEPIADKYGGKG
ncbi:MAG: hypothetical protein AABX01_05520 [Candidatus Micrarchaeota archaeon]